MEKRNDTKITFQNLRIAPYEVRHLLEAEVTQRLNEHGTLYVKAILPEEHKDRYVERCTELSGISLAYIQADESESVLFQGLVRDIQVRNIGGIYYMEIRAVSYSYLLDIEKRTRTFQQKNMSYEMLMEQVAAGYERAGVADFASQGAAVGQLLVQYQETDWEFLRRLASHFHTGLVSDVYTPLPWIYFGIPIRNRMALSDTEYLIRMDAAKFLQLTGSGVPDLMEYDFLSYQVNCEQPVDIGDRIDWNGRPLYVSESFGRVENGIFSQLLTLTSKNAMCQPQQGNNRIAGCSLNGQVKEIKNDQVKVSFDMDAAAGHSPGTPCFFPYSTIYSSKDGSGWYCMPELGDCVRVYFPDETEDHAYAVSSVHYPVDPSVNAAMQTGAAKPGAGSGAGAGGGYSGQRDDPNVKSIRNKDGKEIRLTPEGVYILADGTYITLLDDGGVAITSDRDITFESKKNIVLYAEQDVTIVGDTGVDISCLETASIKMKEKVEIVGQEVNAN